MKVLKSIAKVSTTLVDIEAKAIPAFARLDALAALLASNGISDYELSDGHLFAIGDLMGEEVQKAKAAFYEMMGVANG